MTLSDVDQIMIISHLRLTIFQFYSWDSRQGMKHLLKRLVLIYIPSNTNKCFGVLLFLLVCSLLRSAQWNLAFACLPPRWLHGWLAVSLGESGITAWFIWRILILNKYYVNGNKGLFFNRSTTTTTTTTITTTTISTMAREENY
ncbi:hypothetical protein CANARDRAFT_79949 [[Candida] arabinofermentans NRRL YB-2248]|uniref:Uncharacterized protein n=1 Tax=[Candida] arabinofermentans NRRL YB-2248 TaxID=983967 RepID=A0A1E4SVH0_9ASCO|nr:hypothetical protein CANARDRAFT_79949 [[Candida] arabinofermentans NRRL YB-2248]